MNRTVVWCLCKLSFQWSQKLSPVTNFPSVTFWILFLPSPSSPPPEPLPLLFFHIYNPFLRCKLSVSEVTWNYLAGSALKSKFIFYNSPLLKSYWFWYFSSFSISGFYQVDVLQCTNDDNLLTFPYLCFPFLDNLC